MLPDGHLITQELPQALLLIDNTAISKYPFFARHHRVFQLKTISNGVQIEVPAGTGFGPKTK